MEVYYGYSSFTEKYNFSEETLAAIDEARRISKDSSVKSYSSVKELFEDCE